MGRSLQWQNVVSDHCAQTVSHNAHLSFKVFGLSLGQSKNFVHLSDNAMVDYRFVVWTQILDYVRRGSVEHVSWIVDVRLYLALLHSTAHVRAIDRGLPVNHLRFKRIFTVQVEAFQYSRYSVVEILPVLRLSIDVRTDAMNHNDKVHLLFSIILNHMKISAGASTYLV